LLGVIGNAHGAVGAEPFVRGCVAEIVRNVHAGVMMCVRAVSSVKRGGM